MYNCVYLPFQGVGKKDDYEESIVSNLGVGNADRLVADDGTGKRERGGGRESMERQKCRICG